MAISPDAARPSRYLQHNTDPDPTRERLLEAAVRLWADHGRTAGAAAALGTAWEPSTRDIAEAAGASESSMRKFDGKRGLISELYERCWGEVLECMRTWSFEHLARGVDRSRILDEVAHVAAQWHDDRLRPVVVLALILRARRAELGLDVATSQQDVWQHLRDLGKLAEVAADPEEAADGLMELMTTHWLHWWLLDPFQRSLSAHTVVEAAARILDGTEDAAHDESSGDTPVVRAVRRSA